MTRPTTVHCCGIMTRVWSKDGEKSLSAICLPAVMFWADTSDSSHSPGAGILMLLLLWCCVPMFYSGLSITNRNREGQNICISAESDGEVCLGLWLVRLSLSRLLIGCLGALSQLVVAIWLPMTLHCCQLFAKLNCHNLGLGITVKTPSSNQWGDGDGSIQSGPGNLSPCALSWYMNAAWWKA